MKRSAPADNIKTLKEALRESQASHQVLLNSSLDCIVCTDAQARITEFNSASERVFRISRSVALGKDLPGLLFPNSQDTYRKQLFGDVSNSDVQLLGNRVEITAMRSDGSDFPAELTVTRILVKKRPTFVLYIRDITRRKRAEQDALWLAAVVASSRDAIISKDLNGRIMSWNRGAEEMYGYSAEEAIGRHISMLAPQDRPDEIDTILNKLRDGQEIKRLETVRVSKSGKPLNVLLTVSPVRDGNGRITGASVLAHDTTAEKMAQEALRKANETSIYSSPVPIIAADIQGQVTIWNPAAEKVFGWSENEVIGKPVPTIPFEEKENALRMHRRLLSGETLTGIEVRRQRRDGSTIIISLSGSPLWDEHSRIKGIIGFHTDITDLKQAEESLRRAEEKYRSIVENAVEGIYQATPDGKYISANPALARMFGFDSYKELIATRNDIGQQEYINPDLRAAFIQSIEERDVVRNFEYEAKRRDGKRIWLTASAHAVRDSKGRLLYFEGTVQDITERRDLEHQLRQMQKIEAIGRMAGGVAHDVNNILMAISSYAELLSNKSVDETTRRYVGEIVTAVNRGSALTKGLLTFSRKQILSPTVLDLNTVVVQQLEMLKRLIPENVELKFVSCASGARVKADPSQMEQIVMNLVINARDAMPGGGTVVIETSSLTPSAIKDFRDDASGIRNYVLLSVTDNGCGMDAETKSHLFEPFYTTKEQGKGTGLGLATVFGIVQQSSGQIFVQSELKQGTTIKIYLPQAEERVAANSRREHDVSVTGSETILVVEDESAVLESTSEYLIEHGYTVLKARNGAQGLHVAEQHRKPIHLLLTDLVMPQMSGRELSNRIVVEHPETRTIFMSGYSKNLLSDMHKVNPDYVLLQKPFQLNVLGQCIRRTLDRKKAIGAGT
jgi:two-component system, cell cycle sensor histidine kinase and response regulator CckA